MSIFHNVLGLAMLAVGIIISKDDPSTGNLLITLAFISFLRADVSDLWKALEKKAPSK